MNTDRKKEIRVGIVALLSLLVLIAGITVGKGLIVGFLKPLYHLHSHPRVE